MALPHWFWVVFALLPCLCPTASAQPSTSAISPARTTVPEAVAANSPLLDSERIQLTEAVIDRIKNDSVASSIADVVAFGHNGTTMKQNFTNCKTYPGDVLWPSQSEWDIFNALLDDGLIPTVPVASTCYDSKWRPKDVAKCNHVVSDFTKYPIHENDPTSIMWPIYQGKTCMARNNTTSSDRCSLGAYPEYAVNVSSVAQIQLTVNFIRNLNIRLVIKNTGHDYLGKSTGAGSVAIWTHNIKDIIFLPEYEFEGYSGKAFKVGAGVTLMEIYHAASAHGVTVLGGICPSVGYTGGYLQGAGHTPLSGLHGMGADAVLAYQVVTADGRYVTALKTSHPDLFWALRGGGPGTYGIVTSAIVKVYPETDVTLSTYILGNSTDGTQLVSRSDLFKALRVLWDSFPAWTDANTYSFFFVFNTNGQLTLDMRNFFAVGHTPESYTALTKRFFDAVKEYGLPFQKPLNNTYYPTFLPAYMDAWGKNSFPLGLATSFPGNRLIPKSMWNNSDNLEVLWKTVVTHIEAGRHFGVYHQAPGNPQNVNNTASSAWRNAQSFFITKSANFAENASAEVMAEANREVNEDILQPWRDITPASEGGGSYLNEANVDEPNWKEDFYGDKYARLVEIKKKYDPWSVFYATTAVGSDEWEIWGAPIKGVTTQNGRLCRVGGHERT